MKLKYEALSLYMLCLLVSVEIHQINTESWTPQPLLRPYEEDEDENSTVTPGSMSKAPNKNENVAVPTMTQFSSLEGMSFMRPQLIGHSSTIICRTSDQLCCQHQKDAHPRHQVRYCDK